MRYGITYDTTATTCERCSDEIDSAKRVGAVAVIVMALVAHPTDAFDLIGGTLANHHERGDEVHICFTHNRMHEDAFRLADRIRTGAETGTHDAIKRESEIHASRVREACEILGIEHVSTIGYEGEVMTFTPSLVDAAATRIQEIRPQLLISHNPLENAGVTPHAVCGQLALEGMRLARGARGNGMQPHRVAQLFLMCNPGSTTWVDAHSTNRYPAIQIDVTRHIEKKVRALCKLEAQSYSPQMAAKLVEATSGVAAIHQRITYAEHFQAYFPDVQEFLPVSEHNLRLAEELNETGNKRLRMIAPYLDEVVNDR